MPEQPTALEATRENCAQLVVESSQKGLVLVLLDLLGPDDARTGRCRQVLFDY